MTDIDQDIKVFLSALDAIFDKLEAPRRPQDEGAAECSPREIRTLKEIGLHESLKMSELALRINVPLSTATRIVDQLVAKNLLERRRSANDGRIIEVCFANLGKQIDRYIQKTRKKDALAMLQPLTETERSRFLTQLSKLIQD